MTRILAATDLSAASHNAVKRAARLAAERDGQLHLAHAISPGPFDDIQRLLAPDSPPLAVALANDASRQLQDIAHELAHTATHCQVIFGKPVDSLLDHADIIAADLLVVGSRGEGLLRQLTIGSTALRLLRKMRCPALIVKNPAAAPYRRALVAMDFSPAALAALRLVRQIAPEAEQVLLHAIEVPFERKMHYAGVKRAIIQQYRSEAQIKAMQQLHRLVEIEQLPPAAAHLFALPGNPTDLILQQARVQDCDLIAVGKRGLHIVEELLLGSTTRHLLAEGKCDVLVASDG
ncbi:MAG: universal stress protein [Azonexus sp.]|nr:universal stress protein [Azonexus sp.]